MSLQSYICLKGALFPNFHKKTRPGLEDGKEGILVPGSPPKFSEIRGFFRPNQFLAAVRTRHGSRGSEIRIYDLFMDRRRVFDVLSLRHTPRTLPVSCLQQKVSSRGWSILPSSCPSFCPQDPFCSFPQLSGLLTQIIKLLFPSHLVLFPGLSKECQDSDALKALVIVAQGRAR